METMDETFNNILLDFCKYFTFRDIKNLLCLFCKNPKCILFGSDDYNEDLNKFEKGIKKLWARSEESILSYSGPTFFFKTPGKIMAIGTLTFRTKKRNNLYLYSYFKCNVICIKEDQNWKIEELKILPVKGSKLKETMKIVKNLSFS